MNALLAAALLLITGSHAPRIALLDLSPRADASMPAFRVVRESLRDELRAKGFDVVLTQETYDSLRRHDDIADYYIDISDAAHDAAPEPVSVNVGTRGAGVEVGAVTGVASAQVRLFDGRTLDLIHSYDLEHHSSGLAPTAIGTGSRGFFASIFIAPIFERAQMRNAARAVARDAARRIAIDLARP